MKKVGKEKDIQWGEGPVVFAQSIRPAGKKTKKQKKTKHLGSWKTRPQVTPRLSGQPPRNVRQSAAPLPQHLCSAAQSDFVQATRASVSPSVKGDWYPAFLKNFPSLYVYIQRPNDMISLRGFSLSGISPSPWESTSASVNWG